MWGGLVVTHLRSIPWKHGVCSAVVAGNGVLYWPLSPARRLAILLPHTVGVRGGLGQVVAAFREPPPPPCNALCAILFQLRTMSAGRGQGSDVPECRENPRTRAAAPPDGTVLRTGHFNLG